MTITENEIHLEEHTLNVIKDTLQTELLKRGFLAPISVSLNLHKGAKIVIESEDFQTVPVIFKKINIVNFGGSVKAEKKIRTKWAKEEYEDTIYRLWIPVDVRYDHFNSGSNGSRLFTLKGWVSNEQFSDKIYELSIS